jgi:hypothetical protein
MRLGNRAVKTLFDLSVTIFFSAAFGPAWHKLCRTVGAGHIRVAKDIGQLRDCRSLARKVL